MVPIIYALNKNHKDYKYGFRWAVRGRKYTHIIRTFKAAFRFWWYELKNTPNLYRRLS